MVIERLSGIRELSTEEKWMLVDELWADILTDQLVVADPVILEELERRMAHYQSSPESATTWEAIRERLRATK